MREPGLQQWSSRRENEIGKTYREREYEQNLHCRVFVTLRLPVRTRQYAEQDKGNDNQSNMKQRLPRSRQRDIREMGIRIPCEQQRLEKQETSRPDRGSTSEP